MTKAKTTKGGSFSDRFLGQVHDPRTWSFLVSREDGLVAVLRRQQARGVSYAHSYEVVNGETKLIGGKPGFITNHNKWHSVFSKTTVLRLAEALTHWDVVLRYPPQLNEKTINQINP